MSRLVSRKKINWLIDVTHEIREAGVPIQLKIFGFGKHKGKTVVEVLEKEPGYFGWLLEADFPLYTKKVLTAIRLNTLNQS